MSCAITFSRSLIGVEAPPIKIETHLMGGTPTTKLVGLPETMVKESIQRVKSAILNTGYCFPDDKILVNLAPAHLPKEGSGFDLPIAISILVASRQIPAINIEQYEFISELSLYGELRGVPVILPQAMQCQKADRTLCVASINAAEASLPQNNQVLYANSLKQIVDHLRGIEMLPQAESQIISTKPDQNSDLKDVYGQLAAKQALEIAAAGGHHLLLMGAPGSGKSMLAYRLSSVLPELSTEQALEVQAIYATQPHILAPGWAVRPFRAPHHTCSSVAIVGGGNKPVAGEITLAHMGVLFLDEFPEFERRTIEALRQPLERGIVAVSRVNYHQQWPARCQLIAAMNPCPCGYVGHPLRNCLCTFDAIKRYQQKISGPILDRIDLQVEMDTISPHELIDFSAENESSDVVRQRVVNAQFIQLNRQRKLNVELSNQEVHEYCVLQREEEKYLEHALTKLQLSARSFYRLIKVARTIADLSSRTQIDVDDISTALIFRQEMATYYK